MFTFSAIQPLTMNLADTKLNGSCIIAIFYVYFRDFLPLQSHPSSIFGPYIITITTNSNRFMGLNHVVSCILNETRPVLRHKGFEDISKHPVMLKWSYRDENENISL